MNFSVYWQHADAVSKTLYFVLLAMSIATWTIFVQLKTKLAPLGFEQRKAVAEQALVPCGVFSMRWLQWVKAVRLVWHKWQPQSVKP